MGVLPSPGDLNPDEGVGVASATPSAESPRTGFLENVAAGYQAAQAGPGSTRSRQNAVEATLYDQMIKALAAEGEMGEDRIAVRPGGIGYRGPKDIPVNQFGIGYLPKKRPFRNPYTDAPSLSQGDNPLARLYLSGDRNEVGAIWEAIKRVRQRKPDFLKEFPDEASLARRAAEERKRRLAEAGEVTSRAGTAGTVGAFIGAIGGSIAAGDPENFAGVGVGVAAGKTVARTVIKRATTEGAINAAAGVVALPGQAVDADRLDEEFTSKDMVRSIAEQGGVGVALGAVFGVAPSAISGAMRAGSKTVEASVDAAARLPAVRDLLINRSISAGTVEDRALLREYRRLHNPYNMPAEVVAGLEPETRRALAAVTEEGAPRPASGVEEGRRQMRIEAAMRDKGVSREQAEAIIATEDEQFASAFPRVDTSTPDERAAVNVIERDVEIREQSPLSSRADGENEQRLEAVASALGVDLTPPELPRTTPLQTPTVADRSNAPAPRRAASYEEGLHRAEGTGKNPDSSATGHFQFIDSTWLEYAPKVTNTAGMSRSQILALRNDRTIAARAERQFRADNARYLRERGVEDSPGNLSLAHFLGKRDAARVLRAAPDTPIGKLVDPNSIRANRNVFKKISTAQDMIAWGHRRIGAAVDAPPARAEAIDEGDDLIDYMDLHPHAYGTFTPDDIETDAGLFQYKSGGDQAGVTDKLAGVTAWNPTLSSEVMLWERSDGRRFVVDGHQRTGLAKRLYLDDPSIRLRAIVFRESEGITPEQARTIGALRNIALGTGSLVDNARVLRDAPEGGKMIKGAENRREIEGLARLNYETFGAVANEVVEPQIAAQIGLYAADKPEAHVPLLDLLLKERIGNPKEAARVVRQALADGFGTAEAEQLSLLGGGAEPQQALYVPIARILDASAKRLRDERRTFKVLAEKAGRIEEAGNVLAKAANESKVVSNDEALAIIEATAYRSGPVRDALIAAARAELSGARRADAVGQFLDALAGIDLRVAARGVEQGRGDGAGDGGPRGTDAAPEPDADVPERSEPSPFDHAIAAREEATRFSDPVGPQAKEQTELLEHDLRMDAEAALETFRAERAAIAAQAPPLLQRAVQELGAVVDPFDDGSGAFLIGHSVAGKRIFWRSSDQLTTVFTDRNRKGREYPDPEGERFAKEAGLPEGPLDLGGRADPAIAERQRQEAQLRAESPLRPGDVDAEDTMGLALFDVADQPTFRLSDEGDARPLPDIIAEADSDETAAQAALNCLKGIIEE